MSIGTLLLQTLQKITSGTSNIWFLSYLLPRVAEVKDKINLDDLEEIFKNDGNLGRNHDAQSLIPNQDRAYKISVMLSKFKNYTIEQVSCLTVY